MKEKFLKDVDSSNELIVMFCQCIISSWSDKTGSNDPLLKDILPNIREIKLRINNLIPTIVNEQILFALKSTLKFASFAISAFNEFEKTGQINSSAIVREIEIIQGRIQTSEQSKQAAQQNDITVEEFWSAFQEIKNQENNQNKSKISSTRFT